MPDTSPEDLHVAGRNGSYSESDATRAGHLDLYLAGRRAHDSYSLGATFHCSGDRRERSAIASGKMAKAVRAVANVAPCMPIQSPRKP